MKQLTEIPLQWLEAKMPNLDFVGDLPANLSQADVSWLGLNHLASLILKAQIAATHANSWRDKIVGATAFAIDPEQQKIGILSGFNVKPQQADGPTNIHAEQMAIERTRHAGFKHIAALAIWGEPESDEASGTTPLTLHPCDLCTDFMEAAPEIDQSTAFISGNSDFSTCETYSFDDLSRYSANLASKNIFQRMNLTSAAMDKPGYDEALMFLNLQLWTRLNPTAAHAPELAQWFAAGQPSCYGP